MAGVGGNVRLNVEKGSTLDAALSAFTPDEPEYHEIVAQLAMMIMHRSMEQAARLRRAQRKVKVKRELPEGA